MFSLAHRILLSQRGHVWITLAGIGVSFALMSVLLSVREGVKEGATGYIERCGTDIWVSQDNATNLLRSSSFLPEALGTAIGEIDGVAGVAPLLRILTTATIGPDTTTVFLLAVSPQRNVASPAPLLVTSGELVQGSIFVDRALATRHRLRTGDTIGIQDRPFRIAGITAGTNAIVTQLTFCAYEDGRRLLGFHGVTSFFQVRVRPGEDPDSVATAIRRCIPGVHAYTREQFTVNTVRELETGLLPVLWTIAMLAVGAGAAVISLLLYGSVVVRRQEYALLKALGAARMTLYRLVIHQAVFVAACGSVCGLALVLAATPLLASLAPELTVQVRPGIVGILACGTVVIASAGAVAPLRAIASIDPEEVFRS